MFGLLGAAILMALDQDQPLARPMRRCLCLTLGYRLLISLWPGVSLAAHLGGLLAGSCIWAGLIYGGGRPCTESKPDECQIRYQGICDSSDGAAMRLLSLLALAYRNAMV